MQESYQHLGRLAGGSGEVDAMSPSPFSSSRRQSQPRPRWWRHEVALYRHLPGRLPQKIYVPRFVDVTMSMAPSLFRSTANIVDPTPERLWINSGLNSAPPGALGLRTVRNQYRTGGPNGSGSV